MFRYAWQIGRERDRHRMQVHAHNMTGHAGEQLRNPMAGRLGCTSKGHERLGVPGAAGEGEEEVGARKRRRPASRAASRGA